MEKRIGSALIMIEDSSVVPALNEILTRHGNIIIGRQGIPLRDRQISIISLVLEGTTDEIGALTGQIGRLKGVQVKSVLTKNKEQ
ncbi:MAG TPA: TM1266 family iron-only hydrogenase system putative regulator [Bacteroidales bacterium]|nr:TM1266 family iron-only hydrogenase system putative regulator [Bacteroidales bacterium]